MLFRLVQFIFNPRQRQRNFAFCTALALVGISTNAHAQVSANYKDGGALVVGTSTTTCDATIEGGLRWNTTDNTFEMCDGASWRQIVAATGSGASPQPDPNVGYFVLSASTHNGNFGGITGADSTCLTELTNEAWQGKTDAQSRGLLTGTKVKAWLCNTALCNELNALQTYQFAVAGDESKGGATMTMDSSSKGPGNTQNWSGSNYFGAATYWTGRSGGTDTLWAAHSVNSSDSCASWSSTSTYTPMYGSSNSITKSRWYIYGGNCSNLLRFVCIVHP